MHLLIILVALGVAWSLRHLPVLETRNWRQRFERTLFLFLFPPLLLLMTAIAVLCMGPQGQMVGLRVGWLSYILVSLCLGVAAVLCIKLGWQGWQSIRRARQCPKIDLEGKDIRILDTEALFAAQIGFWQPELIVSQGLLQISPAHLHSVLTHEQAHYYYRDTFWFFWLSWIRDCTAWLPNTDALWQELLVLRELRADHWAAQQGDPLLLAESLLMVVGHHVLESDIFCAALASSQVGDRLEQRIDALLSQPEEIAKPNLQSWSWFLCAFLPLLTVALHS
ncbi:M56 family metallopeptidase [Gloeocapsopsis dulcis]|uniref:Zn-dependent protease with chaperone function n=1 Tax=Gloeocapsopsis dulcis AAB1 = 1H9 TaxID=1433147 RepID=A0A6N8FR13_9CHRO|nr:M56 family metallopeptidase [Gloeocapsopsis dulcis]MUL35583.1 Zn-dependent protease with chaperone function [Gloeocapsopsis dulcis AAB1 = 1H9]WNN87513.1 M56 family metallopeptidase [Gloeocapsopsis dulcis]